jgi:hypothetical protein
MAAPGDSLDGSGCIGAGGYSFAGGAALAENGECSAGGGGAAQPASTRPLSNTPELAHKRMRNMINPP